MDSLNGLRVINLDLHCLPDFREKPGKEWITFGDRNDYPDYLIECFQRSAKHQAIITGKVDYILGNGWKNQKNFQPNPDENLLDFTSKIALDLELFNGCYIEVLLPVGSAGKKQFRHIPFQRMRTNKSTTRFYYSRGWNTFRPDDKKYNYKDYPAYDPGEDNPSSIYYFQYYTPKIGEFAVYPLPEYNGAIPYIEIDYEIANFHLNNIKNSFWGSFLINFYAGKPSEEEQDKVEKQIKKKFAGSGGDKIVLNFADSKERGAEMQSLNPNDQDKLFMQLNEQVQQEIFTAHKVTSPMLFGIKTAGQLGGRNELLEAFELFNNTYISGRQQVLEDIMNYLFTGIRESKDLTIEPKQPLGVEVPLSESTFAGIFTPDELKQIAVKKYNIELSTPELQIPKAKHLTPEVEARLISHFRKCGAPVENFDVWRRRKAHIHSDNVTLHFDSHEGKLYKVIFTPVIGEVSVKDKTAIEVLRYIDGDYSDAEIRAELNITEAKLKKIKEELVAAGLIKNNALTTIGSNALAPPPELVSEQRVMYKYIKDPSVSGPVLIPTSREFCKELVGMNKLFTREEIEQISNVEDYSVFLFRGGWYHRPSGETTPYCRHMWESVVVTERKI